MSKLYSPILAIIFLASSHAFAFQKKPVSGTIVDVQTKEPLSGASVQIKNSTIGTTTDAGGRFALDVDPGATLIFSYSGYGTQEIDVRNQSSLSILLSKGAGNLDEVVVVGYGTQRKREVTGAVASVKSEDFTKGFAKDAGWRFRDLLPECRHI